MEGDLQVDNSPKVDESMAPTTETGVTSDGIKYCNLCGCSTPAVKCDKCGSQTFCLSCDDMYHRHPKRRFHLRKAVDSIWSSHRSPRFRRRTELPGDPSKIPVPPPRTKKRHFSSDFVNMFRPNFQIPGLKGYLTQRKAADSKGQEPNDKSVLPVSPELSYENSVGNGFNPNDESKVKSLQRRSSADNINLSGNTSSPVNMHVPSVSPMQVDSENQSNLSFLQQYPGHMMQHGLSNADLNAASPQPVPPMYPFSPHMHPFFPPHLNPYSAPMAPFNCPQCLHASWSNLMSANMVQYHQHHHIPQQMGAPTANSSRTGTLKTRSPSPETFMRQNQNTNLQVVQGGSVSPVETVAAAVSMPDKVHHTPPPPPPASPSTIEVQNAIKEGQKAQLQDILASDEEMEEEEAGENRDEEDAQFQIPEKPTEPWACVHCTFINPPGSHICDVCCKTSYNVSSADKKSLKKKQSKRKEATGASEPAVAVDVPPGPSAIMSAAEKESTTGPLQDPTLFKPPLKNQNNSGTDLDASDAPPPLSISCFCLLTRITASD